jgi:hypothetical protein
VARPQDDVSRRDEEQFAHAEHATVVPTVAGLVALERAVNGYCWKHDSTNRTHFVGTSAHCRRVDHQRAATDPAMRLRTGSPIRESCELGGAGRIHLHLRNVGLTICVAMSACTATSRQNNSAPTIYAGTWQFPDRQVWITILRSGEAFQCRVTPRGRVASSVGTVSGDRIHWKSIWPTDIASLDHGQLVLSSRNGTFRHGPAVWTMNADCDAPFPFTQ